MKMQQRRKGEVGEELGEVAAVEPEDGLNGLRDWGTV